MTIPDPIRAIGRMLVDGAQGLLTFALFAIPVIAVLIGIPWLISWVIGTSLGETVIAIMLLLMVAMVGTVVLLWLEEQYEYRLTSIRIERREKERKNDA